MAYGCCSSQWRGWLAGQRTAEFTIEHEAIEDANDVTIFEDLGNGQTKLTFIGNEPMERES
jgi:hypothetical protein